MDEYKNYEFPTGWKASTTCGHQNCVNFSIWYARVYGGSPKFGTELAGDYNGYNITSMLINHYGWTDHGSSPALWDVFSYNNHTGVLCGVKDDGMQYLICDSSYCSYETNAWWAPLSVLKSWNFAHPAALSTNTDTANTCSAESLTDVPIIKTIKYDVKEKGSTGVDLTTFKNDVQTILSDPSGWRAAGIAFTYSDKSPEMHIYIATPK